MPTALLTLGRLPKALTLARLLKRAGYRVVIAEPFAWHLGRVSRAVDRCYKTPSPNENAQGYRAALSAIVQREQVTLIVPVSEEIHHVLPLREIVDSSVVVLGPNWDDYEICADKLWFIQRAQNLGLNVPATYPMDDTQAMMLSAQSPCIYKPRRGCSGIGVTRDPAQVCDQLSGCGVVAQQFVAGYVVSSLSWIKGGEVVETVTYQGQVYAGSVAVCFERIDPTAAVSQWINTWCESFDFDGFMALDLIIDQYGQPWGIECNPRLTSGIHFFQSLCATEAEQVPYMPPPRAGSPGVRRWQWAYSTLTEAYAELFRGHVRRFLKTIGLLLTSRDCVWSWADPLPFLLMTPLSIPILWPAITERISMGEACQRDIAPLWDERLRCELAGSSAQ